MNASSSLVAETVWRDIDSTHSVTDDQLSMIADQRGVKRISGEPSGRSFFQVVGESRRKEEYFCFAEHYCACYSFFYDIVNRGEQLSARLAVSLGACVDVKVMNTNPKKLPYGAFLSTVNSALILNSENCTCLQFFLVFSHLAFANMPDSRKTEAKFAGIDQFGPNSTYYEQENDAFCKQANILSHGQVGMCKPFNSSDFLRN
ncbi:hypothetical protein ACSBR2_021718 [Camellia fascicularis]